MTGGIGWRGLLSEVKFSLREGEYTSESEYQGLSGIFFFKGTIMLKFRVTEFYLDVIHVKRGS